MKIKKIKKFNEGYFDTMWDDANKKAVKSYTNMGKDHVYMISVAKPFTIETKDREEYAKMKMIFLKHNIPFTEKVEKLGD